ncbi:hypothetical protein K491DRAFT_584500 [Lophiostoma macrostomum CBS 122681]|uniref:Uncharacterized protein n=1 Tax=Lophiostoma macrostomum CBS 122681 TaxID=1314788 RepID=A0A6A6TVS7_9PLEO|nr:hypothetical protein K491DRAFT_584500 [Lophiostoma macrostomum CBS 122681]
MVIEKLQKDPTTVTTDDARRFHEHFDVNDEHSARLVSAIEAFAAAHDDIAAEKGESLVGAGHASLHTLIQDLHSAVDRNPGDVTQALVKLTQSLVSKMQKAVGNITAAHPELEAELQQEYHKVEVKVAEGTVTKAEADHLHSLEARCHGHTEKGGLTSKAQSCAAKRERQLSDASNQSPTEQAYKDKEVVLHKTLDSLRRTIETGFDQDIDEDVIDFARSRNVVHGRLVPDSPTSDAQSLADKNANLREVEVTLRPKIENEPGKVTKEDAALLQSRERKAHGNIEKGGLASCAQSLADKAEAQAPQVTH